MRDEIAKKLGDFQESIRVLVPNAMLFIRLDVPQEGGRMETFEASNVSVANLMLLSKILEVRVSKLIEQQLSLTPVDYTKQTNEKAK